MGKFASFSQSSVRRKAVIEDDDPMSSLGNLSDCMLVLACGLMVALVVAWNVDLSKVTEMTMTDQVHEVSEPETMANDSQSGGSTYIDMGRVFQDPETGKYYMVEEPAGSQGAGASVQEDSEN